MALFSDILRSSLRAFTADRRNIYILNSIYLKHYLKQFHIKI